MSERAWDSTAVEPVAPGTYRADIGPEWMLAVVPQGGVVVAAAARAIAADLDVDQSLRSIHALFARPVSVGEVEIGVDVVRRGRSMSQARAQVRPDGVEAVSVLAAFGGDRPGFRFTELSMPQVPTPDDCLSYRDPPPPEAGFEDWDGPWPFWGEVVDSRLAKGRSFFDMEVDPEVEPEGECVNWFRFDHPPLTERGTLDPLAMLVLADVMPGSVFQRIGRTEERWFSPSVDLSVHLFGEATPGWILAHSRAHLAGDGYASAEMALWDPRAEGGPALVAWAAQQMLFTRID